MWPVQQESAPIEVMSPLGGVDVGAGIVINYSILSVQSKSGL